MALPVDGDKVEALDEGATASDADLFEDVTRYRAELKVRLPRGSSESLRGHLHLFGEMILDVLFTFVAKQSNNGL
jgi:hypothetical protein